jgi:uncharacterized cupredoxin-like copper-binding protein
MLAAAPAFADAGHHHGGATGIGEPGKASAVGRTIRVVLRDNTYEPASIRVKAGETVRFVVRNEGELLHEFNIGTPAMHAAHQKEMLAMMESGVLTPTGIDHEKMKRSAMAGMHGMTHDDPNSVLVEPGKTAELIWKFPHETTLEYACNIPGHYESGMVGHIRTQE